MDVSWGKEAIHSSHLVFNKENERTIFMTTKEEEQDGREEHKDTDNVESTKERSFETETQCNCETYNAEEEEYESKDVSALPFELSDSF